MRFSAYGEALYLKGIRHVANLNLLKSESSLLKALSGIGPTNMTNLTTNTWKQQFKEQLLRNVNHQQTRSRGQLQRALRLYDKPKALQASLAATVSFALLILSACGTTSLPESSLPSPDKVQPTPPSIPFDLLLVPEPCYLVPETNLTYSALNDESDRLALCSAELYARLYRLSTCARNITQAKECISGPIVDQ